MSRSVAIALAGNGGGNGAVKSLFRGDRIFMNRFPKTCDDLLFCDARESALNKAEHAVAKQKFKLNHHKPYEDQFGTQIWGESRTKLAKVILSPPFELVVALVIILNVCFIVMETNLEALCYPVYKNRIDECPDNHSKKPYSVIVNIAFVAFYAIESALKIIVLRRHAFKEPVNVFDFFVTVLSVIGLVVGTFVNLSWLRVLRCFRLFRVINVFAVVPELHMLCVGFLGSMRAILFGTIMIAGMLTFSAILLVQYIHPMSSGDVDFGGCDRCSRSFSSVQNAVLTLYQQIVAGDSWGTVSIPVIEHNPWFGVSLCGIQLLVGVGAMNLILAVVVDRAVEAREANKDRVMGEKLKDQTSRKIELLKRIAALDVDSSGLVSKEEIRKGVSEDVDASSECYEMRRDMILADVTGQDLLTAFDLLDVDGTGEISYMDLCDVMDSFQAADVRKVVVLSKLQLNKIEARMHHQDHKLERLITTLGKLLPLDASNDPNPEVVDPSSKTVSWQSASVCDSKQITNSHSCHDTGAHAHAGTYAPANLIPHHAEYGSVQDSLTSWQTALAEVEREAIALVNNSRDEISYPLASTSPRLVYDDAHRLPSQQWRNAEEDDNTYTSCTHMHGCLARLRAESERTWRKLLHDGRSMSASEIDILFSHVSAGSGVKKL